MAGSGRPPVVASRRGFRAAGEGRIALIACAAAAALLLALAVVPGSPLRGDDEPATTARRRSRRRRSTPRRPVKAPAHWLPPEDWVYNHWLPYDEGRLYALLGVTRGEIWRQLRDDRHNLAAARRRSAAGPTRPSSPPRSSRRAPATCRPPCSPRCAARARAHDHPGPPLPAPVLPLAAPVRDPQRGAGDLRRHRHRVSPAAPRRAEPAGDRPAARPLAVARSRRCRPASCASAPASAPPPAR